MIGNIWDIVPIPLENDMWRVAWSIDAILIDMSSDMYRCSSPEWQILLHLQLADRSRSRTQEYHPRLDILMAHDSTQQQMMETVEIKGMLWMRTMMRSLRYCCRWSVR